MVVELTPRTKVVIARLFHPEKVLAVEQLLMDECGTNLPFDPPATPEDLERAQLTVLKLGGESKNKLLDSILLTKRDRRDGSVWAGFGNDLEAHIKWAKKILKS